MRVRSIPLMLFAHFIKFHSRSVRRGLNSQPGCWRIKEKTAIVQPPASLQPFQALCTTIILWYTSKIGLCHLHIGQVLRLPGSVSLDILHNVSLRITLTVPEVVDIYNWGTSSLPFFYYDKIMLLSH